MNLKISEQLVIGLWLSAAAAIGINSRSAESAMAVLATGAIFSAPMLAIHGLRAPGRVVRHLSAAVLVAAVGVLLIAALSVAERLYLVNGDSYPSWLASGEMVEFNDETLLSLRRGECAATPIEVFSKENVRVLRCGFFWSQPSTKTFIVRTDARRGA